MALQLAFSNIKLIKTKDDDSQNWKESEIRGAQNDGQTCWIESPF